MENLEEKEHIDQFELSKEYLEKLQTAIFEQDEQFIKNTLDETNPADISTILLEFDTEESRYVLDVLENEVSAEVINDLDEDVRSKYLKEFNTTEIAAMLNELDSDDAVDIINELPLKDREEVIASLENKEKAKNILDLLRYEEDVAGGLMAKELIKANVNWSINQCIEEIRRQAENVEKIYSVYVVDDQNILLGRVSLKRIILADDHLKVKDLYDDDVISVETYMDEVDVAEVMRKYDLDAVPVVNVQGKLMGRITIDDIVDVITELAEEERQMMAGISEDVEEDDSVWMLTRARLPWLIIGMFGGLLGAQFIGVFEDDILLVPAMAFFIPLITATGGNVGIQSSSIVLQSLASKSVFDDSFLKRILKVLAVAILNGAVIAGIVMGMNLILGQDIRLAIVVSIALFNVVLLASFMGTVTPLVLDKLGINPALAAGPFITTANDLLGLLVYFTVAHFLI
ncbi:magnesium transporter MgtE [Marivirga tractuosa]|uniref:Magnesium transporter MgtE n=1 Tax=Marivirga tractuosa (strain ATCC 23168 / DSM 4126 / NBRC 15989 / NCIMB 1408 / VKM B-1430 / H-43) TaxID=643867 RepID=E4TVA3_MARTH|nr:magnesium transporter [Marivirga tractuosa]ADR23168.1 magnesium transporter [Marivirga tractuosa DSM 4126]BDD16158.1 magnesium transporter MgtE [Marivirga tractuosa]